MANGRVSVITKAAAALFVVSVIVGLWGIALFDYRVAMIVFSVGGILLALSMDG